MFSLILKGAGWLVLPLMLVSLPVETFAAHPLCERAATIHRIARALFEAEPRCASEASASKRANCFHEALGNSPAASALGGDLCATEMTNSARAALQIVIATARGLEQRHIEPDVARQHIAGVLASWTQHVTDAVQPPAGVDAAALSQQNRVLDIVSDGTVRFNKILLTIFPDLLSGLIDVHCQTADAGPRTFTSCYSVASTRDAAGASPSSSATPDR